MPNSTSRTDLDVSAAHLHRTQRATLRRAIRAEARSLAVDPLLNAAEAAPATGRALSTFWRDVKRGILPAPYYVTPKSPRWRLSELQAAVDAAPRARRIG